MINKIIRIVLPMVMILLIIGISLQYYVSMTLLPEQFVCHKGKLLMQIDGTIYTKAKGVACDFEKGMLIIEETK